MIRAGVTKSEMRRWDFQHGDGPLAINLAGGAIFGFGGAIGGIALLSEGFIILGLLALTVAIVYAIANVYLAKTQKLPYVWCCDSYRSDANQCYSITKHWHELNEDNQAITLPLVQWVYNNRHKKDTYGKPMFLKECDLRISAVERLLEEQKALEYHKPDVDDSDVEAVLEYVDAMKHARETLYPPKAKVIAPIDRPPTSKVEQARQRALHAIDAKLSR